MTDHEIIQNLHRRMDKQDEMLLEIRDTITAHVAESEHIRPHLEELVALWRGSRLLVGIIGGVAVAIGAVWSLVTWAQAHLK